MSACGNGEDIKMKNRPWSLWKAYALFVHGAVTVMISLCVFFPFPAWPSDSASIPVEVVIPEFHAVAVKQDSISMAAVIGGREGEARFGFSLFSTGNTPRKLTGRLAAPLPEGLSLTVEVSFPSGGAITGRQLLGIREVDLVTGIRGVFDAGGNGVLRMKGGNSLSAGQGQVVLVLAVRDM